MKKALAIPTLLVLIIACSTSVLADSQPVHLMESQLPKLIANGITSYYTTDDVQGMHQSDVYGITQSAVTILAQNGSIDGTVNVSDVAKQTWALVYAYRSVPQHKMLYLGASASDHSLVQINIPWYQLAREAYEGNGKKPFAISYENKETVAVYDGLPHGEKAFSPTNAADAARDQEASAL
jgi:hypothetical protein